MGPLVDLRSAEGAVPIERDAVLVAGTEAVTYLQGQLSQDLEALGVGDSAPSLLLQPTGKVDAWLRVTRTGEDELALDVDPGHGEAVLARLQRFKLRTRVELTSRRWAGWALRGPSIERREGVAPDVLVLPAGWPGVAGVDLLGEGVSLPAGLEERAVGSLEALRIECGVPAMGAELTEATIPAEAGQWLVDASVSFTKGCYTGQELVARIDSRGGNVPRPIRGLRIHGDVPAVDSPVVLDGADVGRITSSAASAALGAVALAAVSRTVELGAEVEVVARDGGASLATVVALPMR
ncbi:MAG: YgfZ/GcvT domain-containing protein [Acidimicrobiales bacterium]